ncbi:hypothetical protein [Pajaroellobacter abortibovis]|uniref:Uncharacterized protein n=1 Tax=Pajaroellobacter abortibovis TaxID=1882918 RepID=A0A1L6MYV5_9BACT|nr:hypothetical protein [Pajaroellobacter abortibovis]APS00702.1 hypothetical protein BCY86_08440 [Pajaroellobacter abortibovis]
MAYCFALAFPHWYGIGITAPLPAPSGLFWRGNALLKLLIKGQPPDFPTRWTAFFLFICLFRTLLIERPLADGNCIAAASIPLSDETWTCEFGFFSLGAPPSGSAADPLAGRL